MNANVNRNYKCKRCHSVIKLNFAGLGDDWIPVTMETPVEAYSVLELLPHSCGIYQIGGSTNASFSYLPFYFPDIPPTDKGISITTKLNL